MTPLFSFGFNIVKLAPPQSWSCYKPGLIMLEVAASNWELVTGAKQHEIKANCFGGGSALAAAVGYNENRISEKIQ